MKSKSFLFIFTHHETSDEDFQINIFVSATMRQRHKTFTKNLLLWDWISKTIGRADNTANPRTNQSSNGLTILNDQCYYNDPSVGFCVLMFRIYFKHIYVGCDCSVMIKYKI